VKVCIEKRVEQARGVAHKHRVWEKDTLLVYFMGGSPQLQATVLFVAQEITKYCNMRLLQTEQQAKSDIRISFENGHSWSFVGTDNLHIPKDQPTMNYGWLEDGMTTQSATLRAAVLHEFGHALSLEHEHQHPEVGIPWDKPKVYEHYAEIGWTRQMVDHNIFARFDRNLTQFSRYDPESIMHYPVQNELTIGDYEIPWRTELSQTDKHFLAQLYPYNHDVYLPIVGGGRTATVLSRTRMRRTPGIRNKTAGDVARIATIGEQFAVTDGPVERDGLTWWQLGNAWWVAEAVGDTKLLEVNSA
jgi:hypothetical protein